MKTFYVKGPFLERLQENRGGRGEVGEWKERVDEKEMEGEARKRRRSVGVGGVEREGESGRARDASFHFLSAAPSLSPPPSSAQLAKQQVLPAAQQIS